MLRAKDLSAVSVALGKTLGRALQAHPAARVHGGCINESYRWEGDKGPLFVKIARTHLSMFEAEAAGLQELAHSQAVRVPRILAVGAAEDIAYLALEWIDFSSAAPEAQARLGEQLAQQHRCTGPSFGWHRDNTIGSTPQINTYSNNWVDFFREQRLRYQLDLACRNGYEGVLQQRGAQLLERMGALFSDYQPVPSLLHGDLWGGNWSADVHGDPVIFDPAVYYGDREAEIAMTHLFGGFGPRFYSAYQSAWPLDRGAHARSELYNLYHVLNHLNLFGIGYLAQAESMIARLLARYS